MVKNQDSRTAKEATETTSSWLVGTGSCFDGIHRIRKIVFILSILFILSALFRNTAIGITIQS